MGQLIYSTLRPLSITPKGLPRLLQPYEELNGKIEGNTFQYQPSDAPKFWKDGGNLVDYTEDEMLYTTNKQGFRGNKIVKDESILMSAGCSHTYGIGVRENEVWGSQLADKLGMYHINTGVGGIGADTVALLIKQFFEEGIVPDILAVAWPNVSRKMIVLDEQKSLDDQITDYIIEPSKNPVSAHQYSVHIPTDYKHVPPQKQNHYQSAVKGIQLQSEQQRLLEFWVYRELVIALCKNHNVKLIEVFLYNDTLEYVKERCINKIPRTVFLEYPDYARDNMHFGYKAHSKLAKQLKELL